MVAAGDSVSPNLVQAPLPASRHAVLGQHQHYPPPDPILDPKEKGEGRLG